MRLRKPFGSNNVPAVGILALAPAHHPPKHDRDLAEVHCALSEVHCALSGLGTLRVKDHPINLGRGLHILSDAAHMTPDTGSDPLGTLPTFLQSECWRRPPPRLKTFDRLARRQRPAPERWH